MIESIISSVISGIIPTEYMPLVVVILTAIVGIEQWLASTKRIQANSTVHVAVGIAKKLIGKKAPELQKVNKHSEGSDSSGEGLSGN